MHSLLVLILAPVLSILFSLPFVRLAYRCRKGFIKNIAMLQARRIEVSSQKEFPPITELNYDSPLWDPSEEAYDYGKESKFPW